MNIIHNVFVAATKSKRLSMLVLLLLLVGYGITFAQTSYYETGFEDQTDNGVWQFKNAPSNIFDPSSSIQTHWTIGSEVSRYGDNSLYVVTGSEQMGFETGTYSILAYRTLQLSAGNYDISFDWKASDSLNLFVALVPARLTIAGTNSSIHTNVSSNLILGCPTTGWSGNHAYQHVVSTLQFRASETDGYNLVFACSTNTKAGYTLNNLSISVDNILITPHATANDCYATPTNLNYNATNFGYANLTWQGNADEYDVEVHVSADKQPLRAERVNSNTIQLFFDDLPEGVYNFRVRAVCEDAISQWIEKDGILIYDPSLHCLDYLNLHGSDVVCQYGGWGSYYNAPTQTGVVDYGYGSKQSRHTFHYIEGETDERTNNQLRTKPEGAVASVRLGNWDTDAEWESITYTLDLTEDIGVLQLNYAVVLEDPDHTAVEQPRFTIEILKVDGTPIDAICGAADFKAGNNTQGWHSVGSGYSKVLWKDWTQIALNVRDYQGQTIKIRLTTYDCSQGAHYGYAYFTLDCTSGNIQGVTCGEKPRTLSVDEGFRYRWYKPNNPNEPFYEGQDPTSNELYIAPNDSNFYAVDLISLVNSQCYYTLHASALKQFPKAKAELRHSPEKCRNLVRIDNQSAIYGYYQNDHGTEDSVSVSDCETYKWYIIDEDGEETFLSDRRDIDPIEMPHEGGLLTLKLVVTMANGGCFEERLFTLDVPEIGETLAETTEYICEGGSVEFEGQTYTQAGDYSVYLTNWAGCDSVLTLHLIELAPELVVTDTIICPQDPLVWHGQTITATGVYFDTIPYMSRKTDCDSLYLEHHVTVLEQLLATIDYVPEEICGDAQTLPLSFHINEGIAGYYSLMFDSIGHAGGFDDLTEIQLDDNTADITIDMPIGGENGQYKRPDTYKATLLIHDFNLCQNVEFPIEFDVLYPDTILLQLWSDVLAVTNSTWNGGYEFTAYQWLKDGEPIEGQTSFRLYEEGVKLDTLAEYSVLLTRADDGKTIRTCVYLPYSISEEEDTQLVFSIGTFATEDGTTEIETARMAQVVVYNSLGMPCSVSYIDGKGTIHLPSHSGLYIVSVTDEFGVRETYRVVVR